MGGTVIRCSKSQEDMLYKYLDKYEVLTIKKKMLIPYESRTQSTFETRVETKMFCGMIMMVFFLLKNCI